MLGYAVPWPGGPPPLLRVLRRLSRLVGPRRRTAVSTDEVLQDLPLQQRRIVGAPDLFGSSRLCGGCPGSGSQCGIVCGAHSAGVAAFSPQSTARGMTRPRALKATKEHSFATPTCTGAAWARCGYLEMSTGSVMLLCCRLDVASPGTSADVRIWGRKGPPGAKGHVKDYEVGATCIVLLIVLCLWERGGVFVAGA